MEYFADISRLSSGNPGKGWSALSKAKCRTILVVFVLANSGDFDSIDDIVALLNDHFSALFQSLPLSSIKQPEFTSTYSILFILLL